MPNVMSEPEPVEGVVVAAATPDVGLLLEVELELVDDVDDPAEPVVTVLVVVAVAVFVIVVPAVTVVGAVTVVVAV